MSIYQDTNGKWWLQGVGTDGTPFTQLLTGPAPASQSLQGPSMSARDLITSALRLVGVVAPGENPSAAEAADGLMILNQMLDSWSIDRSMLVNLQPQTFPLTAQKQAYTLGPGGDFNTVRPARIERVSVQVLSDPTTPLEYGLEQYDYQQWSGIPLKNISSTWPAKVWDDGGFPFRTLSFWPIPSSSLNVLIYCWQQIGGFSDLDTVVSMPPGYLKAMRFNLAVDYHAEFVGADQPLPQTVAAIALSSKSAIKSLNSYTPTMEVECPSNATDIPGAVNRAAFLSGRF